ncbi:MAG TPA: hypothetical protein VF898_07230 [Chloroflexota bacterium]
MSRKYAVNPEWIRQAVVVYGALIAIGVVILQGSFRQDPSIRPR